MKALIERVEGEGVDMFELRQQVCEHSFPRNPPDQHWLDSDATFSYCWPCARQARWEEMGNVGPAPFETAFYYRDPIEENIRDGIDGGVGYSGTSDTTVQCEACGDTLHYWLTDYGISDEIGYWRDEWSGRICDAQEEAYALDRLFEAYGDELQAEVAAIAQRWLAALRAQSTGKQ
jgi:hypothetical protein